MGFNSLAFLAFLLPVLTAYYLARSNYRLQNWILLAASLVFYAYWSVGYFFLLLATVILDYGLALAIGRTTRSKTRRLLLSISLGANLGVLGLFKYADFVTWTFSRMFGIPWHSLGLLLPIGISFYTFHSMSYTIDVYRDTIRPTSRFDDFLLYVMFFPQLVAGPIARAHWLLPQVSNPRTINPAQFRTGLYLVLAGYAKKLVVADQLAKIANTVFNGYTRYRGLDLVIGTVAFAFQIYGDFSGYTDIARGISRWMGFELTLNFDLPYLSRNPKEFWSRWHISLSTWFRDYVYIPLGGNRGSEIRQYANVALTMVLAGLWHGAAWTFVLWGAYHAALLIFWHATEKRWPAGASSEPVYRRAVKIIGMFGLTLIGWVFFRSQTIGQAFYILRNISWTVSPESLSLGIPVMILAGALLMIQLWEYRTDLLVFARLSVLSQAFVFSALLALICLFGQGPSREFIYFQF